MTILSKWLFYVFISYVNKGYCVRIFKNYKPTNAPTRNIPFKGEVISKTCTLKPDQGPCRGGIDMYYYDVKESDCSTFKWGGCQGNGNRFNTYEECQEKCLSKKGAKKPRPKFCMLTYDYGYCFGAMERWYYDNVWKICKKTIYSGCGGNDNNFLYRSQCESVCQYGKGFIKSKITTKSGYKKVLIVNPDPEIKKHKGQERQHGANNVFSTDGKSGADGVSSADGKPGVQVQAAIDKPDAQSKSSADTKTEANAKSGANSHPERRISGADCIPPLKSS